MSILKRYKFILEYDGSRFFGWQRQLAQPTVQQTLEEQLTAFAKHSVIVYGAGRTDTGVHATGQVAHADLSYPHSPYRLQVALNHFLVQKGISVVACEEVDHHFHARYDAISRSYQYRILNRVAPAACNTKVWHIEKPLDAKLMNEAAQKLVGSFDFSSFRDSKCQSKSPIKTISLFSIEQQGDYIFINISAPSFLHHQVRIMVGTIKAVGRGAISIDDFLQIRDAKDRTKAGVTAPSNGLTLTNVEYGH